MTGVKGRFIGVMMHAPDDWVGIELCNYREPWWASDWLTGYEGCMVGRMVLEWEARVHPIRTHPFYIPKI